MINSAMNAIVPDTSSSNTKLGYRFSEFAEALKKDREQYELAQLSNVTEQKPIAPFVEIEKPRYTQNAATGFYASESVKKDGIANIMLAGDIMCRLEQQKAALDKYGKFVFIDMFPYLRDILAECDFVIGNLETALSESAEYTCKMNRNDGNLNRNAPSTVLDALKTVGFDMLVTANNHCLDGGITGVYQTICHLEQYGLMHTGTFRGSTERKNAPFVIADIDGIKVGFVAYTYGTNKRGRLIKKSGRKNFVNMYDIDTIKADVEAARLAGAEFIIAYNHWGVEFSHGISDTQHVRAQQLADAGVDFIAGSHPHVVEPAGCVTSCDGKMVPVIYSMGNMISSMGLDKPDRRESVMINLQLVREAGEIKIKEMAYIPCFTSVRYEDLDYTTLPLADELCAENVELNDARNRIREVIGNSMPEKKIPKTTRQEIALLPPKKRKSGKKKLTAEEARIARIVKQSGRSEEEIREHIKYCKETYNMRAFAYEALKAWTMTENELRRLDKTDKGAVDAKKQVTIQKLMFVTGWDEEKTNTELQRVKEKFGLGVFSYYGGEYYLLSDEKIEAKLAAKKTDEDERMTRMLEASGWTRKKLNNHMKFVKKYYTLGALDYELMRCWEMSKDDLDTCATLQTTRTVSSKFNTKEGHEIAKNKVKFNRVFKDYIQRKFWINDESATYENFLEFLDGLEYIFLKPINLQQGKGTQKIKVSDYDSRELYDSLMDRALVLVEDCVMQCKEMNELYDNAVNTIRLITVNDNGTPKLLASFFRVGANGSIVDNMASGGLLAGVDEVTGTVVTGATDSNGVVYDFHPNTGAQIKGMKLPHYDMAKEIVFKAILHDPRLKYIGWDVAICDDKAVIIEGNTYPDLGAYQVPFWQSEKKGMKFKFEEYL